MVGPYGIIITVFTLVGLLVAAWGWRNTSRARQTLSWPSVDATVTQSVLDNNRLPAVVYHYSVDDQVCKYQMLVPEGVMASVQAAQKVVDEYPPGRTDTLFYQPEDPNNCTLTPGVKKEDWFVVAAGLGASLLGGFLLLFS